VLTGRAVASNRYSDIPYFTMVFPLTASRGLVGSSPLLSILTIQPPDAPPSRTAGVMNSMQPVSIRPESVARVPVFESTCLSCQLMSFALEASRYRSGFCLQEKSGK